MLDGGFNSTLESSEVKLFKISELPWENMAFPVIKWALKAHLDLRDPLIYLKGCFWHLLDKKFSKHYSRTYLRTTHNFIQIQFQSY